VRALLGWDVFDVEGLPLRQELADDIGLDVVSATLRLHLLLEPAFTDRAEG
jgi:hypothetical protein